MAANIEYFHTRETNKTRKPPSVAERSTVATTLKLAANFIEAETDYPALSGGRISHTRELLEAMLAARSNARPGKEKDQNSESDPGAILAQIEDAHREIEITRAFLAYLAKLIAARQPPPKDDPLATLLYDALGLLPPRKQIPTKPFVASLLLIWRNATGSPVGEMGIGNPSQDAGRGPLMEFMISASVPILEVHGADAESLSPPTIQKAAVELREVARKHSDEVIEAQATIKKLV